MLATSKVSCQTKGRLSPPKQFQNEMKKNCKLVLIKCCANYVILQFVLKWLQIKANLICGFLINAAAFSLKFLSWGNAKPMLDYKFYRTFSKSGGEGVLVKTQIEVNKAEAN